MDNNIRRFSIGIKTVAIVLVLAIFATLIPTRIFIYAESPVYPESFNEPELSEPELQDEQLLPSDTNTIDALYEDVSLRTLNSKTLRQNDGTFKLGTYSFNVHFQTQEGFLEYDNTLVHKIGMYSPVTSDCEIVFSDNKLEYSIGSGDANVSFTLLGDGQSEPTVEIGELPKREYSSKTEELFAVPNAKSRITYRSIYEGVSFEYVLFGRNVKENIILETLPESLCFKFRIITGCEVYLDDESSLHIGDGMIPHAYMEDSAGNLSTDVEYILEQDDDGFILTIAPNLEWLEAEDRVFPVTIDPTYYKDNPSTSTFKDAYVKQGNPTYNSGYDSLLHVGNAANDSLWLKERIYVKIQTLPPVPNSARILNAYIALEQTANGQWYSLTPSSSLSDIIVKEVTSSWTDTTLTWNNQPSFNDMAVDYSHVSSSSAGKYSIFDITSLFQKWYENTSSNYGIVLQAINENLNCHLSYSSVNDTTFSSTNPVFAVTYYDTKGLDSRWSYVNQNAGTAGTVYVNMFTGKPVLTGPGLNTLDEILPLSVYPVYNGYLAGRQFSPNSNDINAPLTSNFYSSLGYGFKLNCWESIQFKDVGGDSHEFYYVYSDGDGTELYFRSYPGIGYVSEDGYDLMLSFPNTSDAVYLISDSNGNEKGFNGLGQISVIRDEYGNQKKFNYDSNHRLTSITFKSASMNSFETQMSFTYTSDGALSTMTGKDSSIYASFYYSTGYNDTTYQSTSGYLRKIVFHDGTYAEYSYLSTGELYKARQGKGTTPGTYCILSYSGGKVSYVSEYSSSGSLGNKCGLTYESKKTVVRTAGSNDSFGNADDILTSFLFDYYGKAVTEYVTDLNGTCVYGSASSGYTDNNFVNNPKKNNKIAIAGSHGEYFKNLINNGSLEYETGWSSSLSNVTKSITASQFKYGSKSLCFSSSNSVCDGSFTQSVSITEPGTYTFSAYVKSYLSLGFIYGVTGAYISLDGDNSEVITKFSNENIMDGWKRLFVTKTFSTAGTYTVSLSIHNMTGSVYFDGVSLIKSDNPASEFDYIEDLAWVPIGSIEYQSNGSVKFYGLTNDASRLTAFYSVNKPASETAFSFSGWSYGFGAPYKNCGPYPVNSAETSEFRSWELKATVYYSEGYPDSFVIPFDPDISGQWQYASGIIAPSRENLNKTITSIKLDINYEDNINYALFRDISLVEINASCYDYNNQTGKIEVARSFKGQTTVEYDATNPELVQKMTGPIGDEVQYTYVSGKHSISTATDSNNLIATYSYNSKGLVISETVSHTNGGKAVATQFDYNNYGNVTSQTDSLGHTSYYSYDTGKGLLDYITNANNHRTKYVYDVGGKLTELFNDVDKDGVHDSGEAGVSYTYNSKDYLTEINNGATVYHFAYDNYGNVTSVSIGTNTTPLVSYSYAGYNGKLLSTTYADGTTVSNTYDSLSRIKTVSCNGVLAYTVTYDGNSNVSSYTDCATGRVYRYEYDALGRALRYYVTLNNAPIYESEVVYDTYGRETGYSYSISGVNSRTSTNTYDQHNRISQTSSAAGDTIQYYYDSLGRVISKQTGDFSECYEYLDNSSDSAKTSSLISNITLKYNGITTRTIEYTYDNLGNILTEDDGITFRQYTYDSLNQLASESYYDKNTLAGESKYYFNSSNGNIGFIKFAIINGIYHSIGSSGHSYGNGTDWKELLTSYDGIPITYDANGNPLSYYNGQSYTFTWQKGRQLASAITGTDTIIYGYDVNGLRISKTVNGTTHTYTYDGSVLLCDKWGSEYIEYFYDASGSPYALNYYNGTTSTKYFFVKNIEGDILELRTSTNTLVARYIYDGWGKLVAVRDSSGNSITTQTHIANLNVLRYRGYVYDNETKLYYLQSRYYDPQIQRFISSDVFISTGQGIVGCNVFSYCNNNPANLKDTFGSLPMRITFMNMTDSGYNSRHYADNDCIYNPFATIRAIAEIPTTIIKIGCAVITAILSDEGNLDKIAEDIQNYDFFNADEGKCLEAHVFSSYKGVPVIKQRISGGSMSAFNTIFLSDSVTNINTVKHEYGHSIQQATLGDATFLKNIAVPSLTGAALVNAGIVDNKYYYLFPWERSADYLGGANRTYTFASALTVSNIYYTMSLFCLF